MQTVPIPTKLNRNGIKQAFPRVSESKWRNLFDNEKNNGLYELRVEGPDKYAYYDVEQLMVWLMERSLYRRFDFREPGELLSDPTYHHVQRHVMAK